MNGNNFDFEKIIRALVDAEKSIITVFGDFSLDQYAYSKPSRDELSVETELVAYQIHAIASYPGIGGTVASNLRSLGAKVICVGLLGNDGHGFELMKCLREIGAETNLMVVSDKILTNTYLKPMRGETWDTVKEINRLDFRSFSKTPEELETELLANLEKALKRSQGVIITDQFLERNCSAVTDKIRNEIANLALKYNEVFFFADSRGFIGDYKNVIQKCNEHEFEKLKTEETAKNVSIQAENEALRYVTMGEKGILIYDKGETIMIPSFPAKPPLDICGAGDATNAGIMLGLTLGLSNVEAALLGACVASVTIEQIGATGTATRQQIKERIYEKNHFFSVNL